MKCYSCHRDLGDSFGYQMHFYGLVADYLGMPRSGVTFCQDCYREILPKWREAIRVTSGQVAEATISACQGDNRPDPEPGDS